MFEFSHYFYRFLDELQGNRLDALWNDPIFDCIEEFTTKARFPIVPLTSMAEFSNESRNPQEAPSDEFMYLDIGNVDTIRGRPSPEILLGHQAESSRMRRVMHKDDVLISTTRPTRNAICVVPDELDGQICSTGFAVLRCKPGVLSKFLWFALRSNFAKWQFERFCSGSGYPAINQETDLPQIRVPKTDNVEIQQEILKQLEPIEMVADQFDEQAQNAREAASRILLAQLNIVLPAEDTANYFFKTGIETCPVWFSIFPDAVEDRMHYLFFHPRQQALDALRQRYRTVHLSEICVKPIMRGEQPNYDETGTVTVLKTVNLKNGYVDYENALKVSQEFFEAYPMAHVQKGDILVASTGYVSMGKVDVYDRDTPAMVDGHVSVLRIANHYDPYFFACFLRSHFGQLQFEKWFTGSSGQIELQPADLGQFIVPDSGDQGIPLKEQERIGKAVLRELSRTYELDRQAERKWQEAQEAFDEIIFHGASPSTP